MQQKLTWCLLYSLDLFFAICHYTPSLGHWPTCCLCRPLESSIVTKKVQFFDPKEPKPKPKPTAFLHLIFLFCLFLQPPPFSPPPKNVIGAQEVHKDKAITPPPPKKKKKRKFFLSFSQKKGALSWFLEAQLLFSAEDFGFLGTKIAKLWEVAK